MESKRSKQMKMMQKKVEDDNDNGVEECAWVLGELKSVLGYQETFVSLRLPRTGQP